ncbi:MAG: hypothetical protein P0Y66_19850 [Candidatus Kaistia colombiensis]|nr:MAG: hypothetical protein P0Y66_19850 [Kaistia sp.]
MNVVPADEARTRAFARVIGPFVTIVAIIAAVRMPEITATPFLSTFFENPVTVWITGAMLLLLGLIIIGQHQSWSSAAAALISLLGWILVIRGVALLTVPQLYERFALALTNVTGLRIGSGLMALIGIWLSYVGWFSSPAAKS